MEIKIEKGQFQLNGTDIVKAVVSPISFSKYADLANGIAFTNETEYNKTMMRLRISSQVVFYGAGLEAFSVTDQEIIRMPRKLGVEISKAVGAIPAGADIPEVLNDGDGIERPILFKLSSPIKWKTQDDSGEFSELEFHAKTFGDIESVVAAPSSIMQALELIKTCAIPVSDGIKLMALSSDLVDQVSYIDGAFITNIILPNFLE